MAKLRFLLLLLLLPLLILMANKLPQETIRKAYNESYKNEALGKYSEAIRDLADIYKGYPETYTVNYRLGWLYYLNKNYLNATEHLEKALRISPASVEVLGTINLIYAARSEWVKVENQSAKIIQIDYYNFYGNYWYVIALKNQAKYDLAAKVCRKMLTILPSNVTFLAELGASLYLAGEMVESKAIFESVIVLDQNNETAKYFLKLYKK